LVGAVVFLFVRRVDKPIALQAGILATVAYCTHIILDFLGVNEGTRGVPILWPFSDETLGFGLNLFGHFLWGDIREGLGSIIRWANVMPVLREIVVMGSIVSLLYLRERVPTKRSRTYTNTLQYAPPKGDR
jgi:membrane-bound metal-dependent hydrolase YbcI (DUF457 family)